MKNFNFISLCSVLILTINIFAAEHVMYETPETQPDQWGETRGLVRNPYIREPQSPEMAERAARFKEAYAQSKIVEAQKERTETTAAKTIQSAGRGYLANKKLSPIKQNELNRKLLSAAVDDNYSEMSELIKQGADINAPTNRSGDTLLHSAVEDGTFDRVKFLIEHGADVNLVSDEGSAPLDVATTEPHPSMPIISLLIKSGAKLLMPSYYKNLSSDDRSILKENIPKIEDLIKNMQNLVTKARREIAEENKRKARAVGALMKETRPNTGIAMTLAQLLGINPEDLQEEPKAA
ncbi:hypothetical protein A3J41_01230 [candidate division TM6 bacterium RIFCSPHIGHO2_12_FULL_38_8]|nr:MAG: hypothetical protein A3J41_01230 [candidate division TM6 bacterium RIFCSPHIGHO2_12_FULL_38_8]